MIENNINPRNNKPIAPTLPSMNKIAHGMGIDLDTLLKLLDGDQLVTLNEDSDKKKSISGVRIPVLGRVAAGIPIEAVEDVIDWEEIPEEMAKSGDFFGLRIQGDSMTPRICSGDVVIVRKQDDAESGDLVIATVNGDDATCKRLIKYETGISLVSTNQVYDPMIFTDKDIETKPIRILGKVIELRGKF